MDREVNLIQPSGKGRLKFMKLFVIGDTLYSEWGLIGGAIQETSNTYSTINKGKSNELSPEEAAIADFERKKEKKIKAGYREVNSLSDTEAISGQEEMDFDSPPTSFSPSKPVKTISDSKLSLLMESDFALFQAKENGLCHFIVINSKGEPNIYTRKMDNHTAKYPDIVDYMNKLVGAGTIGPNTMLITELVVDGSSLHMVSFSEIQRISKTDTHKGQCMASQEASLALQEKYPVRACVFHIPYLNGEVMWEQPYGRIFDEISCRFLPKRMGDRLFVPETIDSFTSTSDVYDYLKSKEGLMEGLVVWDRQANIEITFNGNPLRRGCYKMKAFFEDDVIAYGFEYGNGDRQGRVGSLNIGKYHHETGEIVPMGRVGSGIKDDESDPDLWELPLVIEIGYENRFPLDAKGNGGGYQFPRFSKKHEDKHPSECTTIDDIIYGV